MSDRPRILIFAPHCWPPKNSEAIATAKLITAMLGAGWKVDVITRSDEMRFYPAVDSKLLGPAKAAVHGITVGGGRVRKRLGTLLWVKEAMREARRLLAAQSCDCMISRAMPQYGHLPAYLLSRSVKLPWIACWSDPAPPVKAPLPYGKGSDAPLPAWLRLYYDAMSGRADWHVFTNERLRRHMCSYLPACEGKNSVIPHLALEQATAGGPRRPGVFTLTHLGGTTHRRVDVFLEGLKIFLQEGGEEIRIAVDFFGPENPLLRSAVSARRLEAIVTVRDPLPYDEAMAEASTSDALVVIEADCGEGIFFPSKFADCVQTGLPVLAVSPLVGVLSDIVSKKGGGAVADCRSPASVAAAIGKMYGAWRKGSLREEFGSRHLFDLFGPSVVLGGYEKIFMRVERK